MSDELEKYAEEHCGTDPIWIQKVEERTKSSLRYHDMLSGPVIGNLLSILVAVSSAKMILELGLFTGGSALRMAEFLPPDGVLVSIEPNERYINLARESIAETVFGSKIRILHGKAMDILPELTDVFDLIFLDADKDNYPEYAPILLEKLRPGGLLVADNVFWHGGVITLNDRKSVAVDRFNKWVSANENLVKSVLPVRDGLSIIMKR
jgi:caffeoyl-CoA O-methyltransferase